MEVIGKRNYYGKTFKVYGRQDFESHNRKCPKCGGDCDIDTNIPLYLSSFYQILFLPNPECHL